MQARLASSTSFRLAHNPSTGFRSGAYEGRYSTCSQACCAASQAPIAMLGSAGSATRPTRPGSRATRRGSAPPLDPGPLLGTPAGDLGLVTLGGAPGGALRAPLAAAQQPPHIAWVVADPARPPDHLGDPRQGPKVGVEPVGLRAGQQRAFHPPPVAVRQPRWAAQAGRPGQGHAAALAPLGVPAADVLRGGAEPASDLGLGEALLEASPSAQAALPGCLGASSVGGRWRAPTGSGGGCCACRHEHHAPLTARPRQ